MKLLWCRYQPKDGGTKYILIFELGIIGNNLACLLDDQLSPREKAILRQASITLSVMGPTERVAWIKDNLPTAMKSYRTLIADRMHVIKTYEVKPPERTGQPQT